MDKTPTMVPSLHFLQAFRLRVLHPYLGPDSHRPILTVRTNATRETSETVTPAAGKKVEMPFLIRIVAF